MPTHPAAVLAAQATGHARWLALCDPDDAAFNPDYLPLVRKIAAGEPWQTVPRPAPPQAPRPPATPPSILLRASLTSWTGYGQIAEWLGRGLESNGVPFRFLDWATDHRYLPPEPWVASRAADGEAAPGLPVLQLAVPNTPTLPDRRTVAFTMWESSRVSQGAVAALNQSLAVVVPCAWNRDGFRASGVNVPIHVVPLGVDLDTFRPAPRHDDRPFTVGMSARMAHGGVRKGLNEGMRAFCRAFDAGQDVRLEIKVFEDCVAALRVPDDPRISLITRALTTQEMANWFGGLDVLLVPSKSEGWGLNTLQALACGRPVIATRYSGTAEFFDSRFGWELPFTIEPAGEFYSGLGGWAVPTEEGMVEALRAAYRDPDGCRRKGATAAERAREFSWERTGRELVRVLRSVGLIPEAPAPRFEPFTAEALAAIDACPHRVKPSCGCELPTCKLGKGNDWHLVTREDCRECLREASPP